MPRRETRLTLLQFVVAFFLVLIPPLSAAAEEHSSLGELGLAADTASPHSATHIVVRIDGAGEAWSLLGASREHLGELWFRVPVPYGWEALEWAERLTGRFGVEIAELDLILDEQISVPFGANDPLYTAGQIATAQWHLHASDLAEAWQSTVGTGVTVAILDSGVNNGPDGFCNPFVSEYNTLTQTAGQGAAADTHGHGTHVAGSVAQCSGNGIGGAGMAPDASIMPVKASTSGFFLASDIVTGINWAVDNGAKVINLSLGCSACQSSIINEAIEGAAEADVVIVAASGNTPTNVYYPANHPAVVAVGASTFSSGVALYSAFGLGLDLVAPGGDIAAFIYQETIGGYVPGYSGTSMASAHVSGAVALMRSRFPSASVAQIRNALNCSTLDLGPSGWDSLSGFGLLQAGDAVEQLRVMVESGAPTCDTQSAGTSNVGTIESSSGFWRLYDGSTQVGSFYYGVPNDFGFFGDWDCDGVDTPGLYRQSDGYVYLRNANTQGVADVSYFFGIPGDVPVAGDFNGDGCDTVSIYRPSEARFYIINKLGSADGGLGEADYSFSFGVPGDDPFVGDWNGDGIDTSGLRRDSNGFVYLRNTNTQGVADIDFFYGVDGDVVFAGDWDADGDDTIGLYRPSDGTIYLRNTNTIGTADISYEMGGSFHHAVAGAY